MSLSKINDIQLDYDTPTTSSLGISRIGQRPQSLSGQI